MEIKRSGSQPSGKGPADWFTGTVRIDPLFQANAPARALGASVTFEPRARTAWHTHPLGQTLIVTAGCGLVQSEGGPDSRSNNVDRHYRTLTIIQFHPSHDTIYNFFHSYQSYLSKMKPTKE
jgi:hypothetical protein